MPRHATVPVPKRTVTPISTGAVAAARVQCQLGQLQLQATASNTPPTADQFGGAILLMGGDPRGIGIDEPLSSLFPGLIAPGSTGWLWAYSEGDSAASVSHA